MPGAGGDLRVPAAGHGEETAHEQGAVLGVAAHGGDAAQVEFGAGENEGQGEGVVDVAADVRVEQDGHALGRRLGIKGWDERQNQQQRGAGRLGPFHGGVPEDPVPIVRTFYGRPIN